MRLRYVRPVVDYHLDRAQVQTSQGASLVLLMAEDFYPHYVIRLVKNQLENKNYFLQMPLWSSRFGIRFLKCFALK